MTWTCPTCGAAIDAIETEAVEEPTVGADGMLTDAGISPFRRRSPGAVVLRPCGHEARR